MTRRRTQAISGLREIADRYDGFILDFWGTLHGGAEPYPGVLDCLAELRRRGKHCVLLSNAPRRAAAVVPRVSEIGFQSVKSPLNSTERALGTRMRSVRRPSVASRTSNAAATGRTPVGSLGFNSAVGAMRNPSCMNRARDTPYATLEG